MTSTIHQQDAVLLLTDGTALRVVSPVSVESETEVVRTSMAYKPDTKWSYTDSHGHLHQYVRDEEDVPRLPSLERRSRHVDCDGSCYSVTHGDCDGYDETVWFCRECGDEVEPGFVHDYAAEMNGIPIGTTVSYNLTVEVPSQPTEPLTGTQYGYTDAAGTSHRFALPPLFPGNIDAESGPDGWVMRAQFQGQEYETVKRKPVGP